MKCNNPELATVYHCLFYIYVGIWGVDLDFRLTKILLAELLWVPAWLWLFPTGEDGNLRQYLESSNEKFQKRCILSKIITTLHQSFSSQFEANYNHISCITKYECVYAVTSSG